MNWPIIHDGQIFHFIASRILHGDVAYRDLYDYNMPGTYLLHMLCIAIFGIKDFGFRILDILALALASASIAAIVWRYSKTCALASGLLWAAYHLKCGIIFLGQRDYFMACFMLASSALLLAALPQNSEKKHGAWLLALSGACAAYACAIKPTGILLCALHVALLTGWPRFPMRLRLCQCVAYIVGASIILAAIATWLYITGALPYFYDIVTGYLPAYRTDFGRFVIRPSFLIAAIAGGACIAVAILSAHLRRDRDMALGVIGVGLLVGIANYYLQHKGWIFHQDIAVAFFIIALGYTASRLREWQNAALTLCCFLLFAVTTEKYLPHHTRTQNYGWFYKSMERLNDDVTNAVAFLPPALRDEFMHSAPRPVQVYDQIAAQLHNAAFRFDWRPPSRFIYNFTVKPSLKGPYIERLRQEFANDLLGKKPPVVIIGNWMSEGVYSAIHSSDANLRTFNEMYKLVLRRRMYSIYVRTQ